MKIIYFVLAFILSSLLFSSDVLATDASLRCAPTSGTYNIGDTFTIDYILDTRTFQAFGALVAASIDTHYFTVIGTQSTPVTSSTSWGQPVTNTVDTATGNILLDYGNAQPAFTGSGTVGQLTVKAAAAGQAQFSFKFIQPYDNTTPGVAKVWGKKDGINLSNILTDIGNNCIFIVSAANPTPTTPPTVATTVPTSPPQVTSLPQSGAMENTAAVMGLSVFFIILGIAVPGLLKIVKL